MIWQSASVYSIFHNVSISADMELILQGLLIIHNSVGLGNSKVKLEPTSKAVQ